MLVRQAYFSASRVSANLAADEPTYKTAKEQMTVIYSVRVFLSFKEPTLGHLVAHFRVLSDSDRWVPL